jgi:hypothetical protein
MALRVGGPPVLLGALLVARARKLYQNPFGFDGVFRALVGRVQELCQNFANYN